MAIPRRISFLEESRSQGMANLQSSGIEEDEMYFLGGEMDFLDNSVLEIPRGPRGIDFIFLDPRGM